MKVFEAIEIARPWVEKRASELPDFAGAFFVGSVVHMYDDEDFPATSDIDLRIIVDRDVPDMIGNPSGEFAQTKLLVSHVILEPQYWSRASFLKFTSDVLGNPLAISFLRPNVILDPYGDLARSHRTVLASYHEGFWVCKRCETARAYALDRLVQAVDGRGSVPRASSNHLANITTLYVAAIPNVVQIPCVTDLQGLTLRRYLVASQATLLNAGRRDLYDRAWDRRAT